MTTNAVELVSQLSASESIKDQLREVVTAAIDAGKNAADFAVEQAPLLVREIISYNIAINGLWVAIGVAVLFSLKPLGKKAKAMIKNGDEELVIPLCIFFGIAILFIVLFSVARLPYLLKAIFAPRLFLIEYIAQIVK